MELTGIWAASAEGVDRVEVAHLCCVVESSCDVLRADHCAVLTSGSAYFADVSRRPTPGCAVALDKPLFAEEPEVCEVLSDQRAFRKLGTLNIVPSLATGFTTLPREVPTERQPSVEDSYRPAPLTRFV